MDLLAALLQLLALTGLQKPNPDQAWRPHPNQEIPYPFTVATLDGYFTLDAKHRIGLPLIVHAYLPEDAALRFMWSPENRNSINSFLQDSPEETHYLFISYGLDAVGDMTRMRSRLLEALHSQGKNSSEANARLAKFHFSQAPMSGVSDKGANFLPYLMGQWTSSRSIVRAADLGPGTRLIERLDAAYEWLPLPPPTGNWPVLPFGNGCTDPTPFSAAGRIALVLRKSGAACSFAEIISRAQAANATALLVSAEEGKDVVQISCKGLECQLPIHIFASMIPYAAAADLQEAALLAAMSNKEVEVSFDEESGPGYFAAVDELGRLQEVGWIKFPTLQHLSWAAQWLKYAQTLRSKLDEPALVVPVFENKIMQGEHGITVEIELPEQTVLERHSTLELDFELSCPGTRDSDCPIWDHVVQLFVCCDNDPDCESCDATPWLHQHHPEDPAELVWQSQNISRAQEQCGRELGRWVTPFRRRIGRWLTDVTPLRSMINSQKCRFTAQTAPWALPWKPSLQLRYSNTTAAGKQPLLVAPLFKGGTFDATYNAGRKTLKMDTPKGTQQALLYVVVTGHGYDENQCAEFCPTSHHFTINGHERMVNFTEAATPWGCTKHVLEGVEPNEHGTWQYGRGGWCDGVDVPPWIFDVTDEISAGGEENRIEYRGLFQGKDPDPKSNPGYIMMQSSLVFLGSAHPALSFS